MYPQQMNGGGPPIMMPPPPGGSQPGMGPQSGMGPQGMGPHMYNQQAQESNMIMVMIVIGVLALIGLCGCLGVAFCMMKGKLSKEEKRIVRGGGKPMASGRGGHEARLMPSPPRVTHVIHRPGAAQVSPGMQVMQSSSPYMMQQKAPMQMGIANVSSPLLPQYAYASQSTANSPVSYSPSMTQSYTPAMGQSMTTSPMTGSPMGGSDSCPVHSQTHQHPQYHHYQQQSTAANQRRFV